MGTYSQYIHPDRRSRPTPKDLVDDQGNCVFGTFDREFETMDLTKARHPTLLPDIANKYKLTLWEACEVHLKEGILLAVVCDMAVFGKTLNIFWDKRHNKVYTWDTNLKSKDTVIAPNLKRGSQARGETDVSHVHYTNLFERGKARLDGHHTDDQGNAIEYDFQLERISKPSVVSIPFGKNRPLYSQKDFFTAKGRLVLNGEVFETDQHSVAVIDDHRGYYPRKMHYDWVTTLGWQEIDGEMQPLAFNLTRNQSTDPDRYNENLIWKKEQTSLLPAVLFTRNVPTRNFDPEKETIWEIKDEHDMVNVQFHVSGTSPMVVHAGVVDIDYHVAFGTLYGYLRDEDGNKIILDGLPGMGEDKTMKF